MERVHLNVNGIINSQNKINLKKSLEKIDGVQMMNVDLGRNTVEVGYNEHTNEEEIRNCIENAGYSID